MKLGIKHAHAKKKLPSDDGQRRGERTETRQRGKAERPCPRGKRIYAQLI
jgi:hypothetical protein